MFPQMKISILAGALALSAGALADIPGAFVIQEARIADPTVNSSTTRANFGYAGIAVVGDLNNDGVKDIVAGAPANDSGSLVFVTLGADGKSLGAPTIVKSRDPLIATKLLDNKEQWAVGVAVAKKFSATNSCAVILTNSIPYSRLWAVKICRDGSNVPSINAVSVIDSTSPALAGLNMTMSGIGMSISVLDTLTDGQIVFAASNPMDGKTNGSYEGKVVLFSVDPTTLAISKLSVYPESYESTDPLGKILTPGEWFGNSVAPIRGINGGKGMAVVSKRYSSGGTAVGRIHLIRYDASFKYLSSVVFDGVATFSVSGAPTSIDAADLDGDGVSDLVVGYSSDNGGGATPIASQGAVQLALLDATGKMKASKIIRKGAEGFVDSSAALGPNAQFGMRVAVHDFDEDGQVDLVVGNQGSRTTATPSISGGVWSLRLKYPPVLKKSTGSISVEKVPVFVPLGEYVSGNQLKWTAQEVSPPAQPLAACSVVGEGANAQMKCVSYGLNGISTWKVVASDTGNVPATDHFTQTVIFTVNVVNQDSAPVQKKNLPKIVLHEDQSDTAVLALKDYFRDPENKAMTFPLVPLNGSTSNLLNYSLSGDTIHLSGIKFRHGLCSLQVVVRDQALWTISDTLVVELLHVNHAPTPLPDAYDRTESVVDTFDVLKNDSDPDGDPLTLTISTQPKHGSASIVLGKVRYVPTPFYVGADTLMYMTHDNADSAVAVIAVNLLTSSDPAKVYKAFRDTTVLESARPVVIKTDSVFFWGTKRFAIETYNPKYDCQGIATVDFNPTKRELTLAPIPYKWGRCQILLRAVVPDSVASAMFLNITPVRTPYLYPKDTLDIALQMGATQTLQLDSLDLDGDTIQYASLSPLPSWITLDRSLLTFSSSGEEAKIRITARKKPTGAIDTNSVSDTLIVYAKFPTASIQGRHLGSTTLSFLHGSERMLVRASDMAVKLDLIGVDGRILSSCSIGANAEVSVDLRDAGNISYLRLIEGSRVTIAPLFLHR